MLILVVHSRHLFYRNINIIMMNICKLAFRFSALKPSAGFQAVSNPNIRKQIQTLATPKLNALAEVLLSLNNQELEYLNLLSTERALQSHQSVLTNKIINRNGYQISPISYAYQQEWIKENWKDTNILQFIFSADNQEIGDAVEAAVVKDNYDVELTTVDAAQKIKIIKNLREIFNLGLKEAKDLADKTPSMLKKGMKKEEAEKLKLSLQALGCTVTLK